MSKGKRRAGWSLLLLVILFTACVDDATEQSAEELALHIIDLLRAGEYQTVYEEYFTNDLRASLAQEELEKEWEQLIETGGEFVEVQSLQLKKHGENLEIIEGEVVYTDAAADIRMIFNENRHLSGLNLSDVVADANLPASIIEEEIIIGEGTDYELGGTLTLPKGNQKNLPAVVLVQGSGPSDRDETVFAYKPFRDIAWGLAEQGIAVIRYDKRTFTHAEKMVQASLKLTVFEETVEDAILAAELVKKDERIDDSNVFLIGHSLGGMLAPRMDAQGGDYRGMIILAGSPRPLWEIVYDQNKAVLKSSKMDEKEKQEQLIEEEYEKAKQLQNLSDKETQEMTVFGVNGYYLKEMDQYDAAAILLKHDKPVLLLQGEDDFQVYHEKDFALWKTLLKGREKTAFVSYPNLNHFFVDYDGPNKGTVAEYETANEVDNQVIKDIGVWILENKEEK